MHINILPPLRSSIHWSNSAWSQPTVSGGAVMLQGIALAFHVLPLDLIGRHGLARRAHDRGGEGEIRFLWTETPRVLPVWLPVGRLVLATWGNGRGESRRLPVARWASLQTHEAGGCARALFSIDSRAVQNRLDEVFGLSGWAGKLVSA
jgi:hypothetical protein